MKLIQKISSTLNTLSARIGMLAIVLLLFMTVSDVAGRFLLNKPIPGTFELSKLLFALSVFFSLPVSQYNGENLGITLIYDKFPIRLRGILDVLSSVTSITMFTIAFVQTLKYASRMHNAHTITSVLRMPMYPWIYLASIGIVILVVTLIRDLSIAIKELKGEESNES
jgi:TRAP-type transport system small permease protein